MRLDWHMTMIDYKDLKVLFSKLQPLDMPSAVVQRLVQQLNGEKPGSGFVFRSACRLSALKPATYSIRIGVALDEWEA